MTDNLEQPSAVCANCFNEQQRFSFPFVVYCPHRRQLALVHSRHEFATFECAPNQLRRIVDRLKDNYPSLNR